MSAELGKRRPQTEAQAEACDYLRLGAGVARKGWLTKGDVVNTLSLAELRKALRSP